MMGGIGGRVPLVVTRLEPRHAPAAGLMATAAAGAPVRLIDLETGSPRGEVAAFDGFAGAVSVVLADVTDDGVPDLIVGAGAGGGPRVRVFDGNGWTPVRDFFAFDPGFFGGVSVAAGDVTGDGIPDVIVGAGAGGGPHVRAFDGRTGAEVASFLAFDPGFAGGVSVAAVDLTGDGIDEIVVGAGAGGGSHVRAFDTRTGTVVVSFFAYDPGFAGGVAVAGADPDGAGRGEIVTGTGAGGGPLVRLFGADGQARAEWLAADPADRGGVAVSAFAAGDRMRIAARANAPGAAVLVFDGESAEPLGSHAVAGDDVAVSVAPTLLGPVLHADAAGEASFVDPSAVVSRTDRIAVGFGSYVAPFAVLDATAGPIAIGNHTNVQDNVELIAGPGGIVLGDRVILAHNASVLGDAGVGAAGGEPSFVGFNAVVDGAVVEPDAFVNHLTRVAPGVVIRSGTKTLVGKFVRTQAEADDPALGKVTAVTDADRAFMRGVLHVNEELAAGYAELFAAAGLRAVRGFGANVGGTDFSPNPSVPTLDGAEASGPAAGRFRNRVIGHVHLHNTLPELNDVTGRRDSIRADEGQPFDIGRIAALADRTTFHALEGTGIVAGAGVVYGSRVVVHGGPDDGTSHHGATRIGDGVTLADWSVVFRSTVGASSSLGFRSFVDESRLPPGTVVPDRAVVVKNVTVGFVEW